MASGTIVGYTYRAQIVHPDCLQLATGPGERFDGWALAPGIVMTVEENLDEVAFAFGIDREDESSFDTDDFPKVILKGQTEGDEECHRCGGPLRPSVWPTPRQKEGSS